MKRLNGKSAIITGGAGEIGMAAAKLFIDEGARVLLVDKDEERLCAVADEMNPAAVSYCVADVTQPEQVEAYVQAAVKQFGGIDIFLNNAGIEGPVNAIPMYEIEDFNRVLAINVQGVFLGMKYVLPVMMEKKAGSIIISSSVAGVIGFPGMVAYMASKHAIIGIMRVAAIEAGPLGIRVNTVNPGPVESRMMSSLETGVDQLLKATSPETPMPSAKEILLMNTPTGRYATAEDVAAMMLFLGSDESRQCNGGIYMVDGGFTST
jgi:NAD(P)-dependent dehydrogenase (short-subunit alcohol dehydrogenase family)